jgi:hypothetical protein
MIPVSVLDLVPVRQGETPVQALPRALDLCQHVERWGYQRYWVAEHHNMVGIASSATSVVIGYLAAGTRSIRIHRGDFRMGMRAAHKAGVQLSGQGDVTGIATLALNQVTEFVVVTRLGTGKFERLSRHSYFKNSLTNDR